MSSAVVLDLYVAADPLPCTRNRCGPLRFFNVSSIIEKLDLVWPLFRVSNLCSTVLSELNRHEAYTSP